MLLYHRPVPAKIPKRRSRAGEQSQLFSMPLGDQHVQPWRKLDADSYLVRPPAGCVHCKEKKKKCNEERPQCDRCLERGLKCEYEPVKPRKRRRTVSNPEHSVMRPPTTAPGQHLGFHDRLQALRQNSSSGSSIMSGSPTPPLPAIAENWEAHSAHSVFSDSASSCGSDTLLDIGSPLPPFNPLEGFGKSAPEVPDVKPLQMDPLDGFPKEDFDEDIGGNRDMLTRISGRSSSAYPELAMMAPSTCGSPYDFSTPAFAEFTTNDSRRHLLDHFCNVLSHLLVFKDDGGNAFQQLILPMAHKSSPLLNAIYAISSAHLEHRGLQTGERALDLHSKALAGLAQLIAEKDRGNRDEVLAVIMLLVYYEVVRSGTAVSLNSHLRGALSIMRERRGKRGPTSTFLERTFRYFDVICALSFGTSPLSGTILSQNQSSDIASVRETSAMVAVDTLFGLVADLWPIVHRLSTLYGMKMDLEKVEIADPASEKAAAMRTDFDNNASTVELALHQWTPKIPGSLVTTETPADDSRLQSILNNAEAYKQACFIFLNRSVFGLPRSSPKIQAATKQALQACLRVVIFSGPMCALLWPLFTASCEAIDDVDRNVAQMVFRHLESRQGMQNIVTAWEVAEEVWRRGDSGEPERGWRDIATDMGREVVFG